MNILGLATFNNDNYTERTISFASGNGIEHVGVTNTIFCLVYGGTNYNVRL